MLDNSIIIRLKFAHDCTTLANITNVINQADASIVAIDNIQIEQNIAIRDFTINTNNQQQADQIVEKIRKIAKVEIINVSDSTFLMHLGGKVEVSSKFPVTTRKILAMAYTPGVARVCMAIHDSPEKAYNLTIKRNTVAVVTDGSAVLGLGNIGPEAAMPVMEGKAMLFKSFAGVDAFPICLASQDPETIIQTVKQIAPGFGGINLEDIAAPACFAIEQRLKQELDIPVFHDDQHGTAIVFCAALINALQIVKKKPEQLKVVLNGVGAAGTACTKIMQTLGVKNIIGCDRSGALTPQRNDLNAAKREYATSTNPQQLSGTLAEVIKDADVFVGLSAPNILQVQDIKTMNKDPIVFAMANPTPEIMPEIAAPHVAIIATGRSDYPNQINNLLAFPGVFRGALDCQASDINETMKLAAAYAIANTIETNTLAPDYIVPSVFDPKVADAVAKAVIKAAKETNVAQK